MKGYCIMSNRKFIESETIDNNTLQSKYKVGNSVYIVHSHFAGKEELTNLIFNIICQKTVVHCAEKPTKA